MPFNFYSAAIFTQSLLQWDNIRVSPSACLSG